MALKDAAELEEKKHGVIGRGRKKTDESEHTVWNDVKVPCGKLVPSEHKDSPLEYNEYAVYDPQQVMPQQSNLGLIVNNEYILNACGGVCCSGEYKVLGGCEV